eukprot:TRINITY_DN6176_c0_g1_i1.p1 TRINITY_DN6176_c0_g1~~TRINITY_DN6176_c0_g1_i1.p1  ORF type:complete len:193 (-),score=32.08 TRINITY_DN6176_c0_g1_i1:86-664(-)
MLTPLTRYFIGHSCFGSPTTLRSFWSRGNSDTQIHDLKLDKSKNQAGSEQKQEKEADEERQARGKLVDRLFKEVQDLRRTPLFEKSREQNLSILLLLCLFLTTYVSLCRFKSLCSQKLERELALHGFYVVDGRRNWGNVQTMLKSSSVPPERQMMIEGLVNELIQSFEEIEQRDRKNIGVMKTSETGGVTFY